MFLYSNVNKKPNRLENSQLFQKNLTKLWRRTAESENSKKTEKDLRLILKPIQDLKKEKRKMFSGLPIKIIKMRNLPIKINYYRKYSCVSMLITLLDRQLSSFGS